MYVDTKQYFRNYIKLRDGAYKIARSCAWQLIGLQQLIEIESFSIQQDWTDLNTVIKLTSNAVKYM